MNDLFEAKAGQTPLTADDRLGLIPGHVQTREELDELEADNIAAAVAWLARRRRQDPLSIHFFREVHRQMYGDVWRWAGNYSKEFNRPLGVDANQIGPELLKLIDDAKFWIEHGTFDDPFEHVATFHHRLTAVHPFPNGNGRWARLMTDILARRINAPRISWGGAAGEAALRHVDSVARRTYVDALQTADGHDLGPLTALIHSYTV
jgi:Fic-DOC domain mobile mystery protein B